MRALLFASLCCTSAHAIVPPEYQDPIEPWQSSIEFGWNYDKSNKTTSALNSVLAIEYDADQALSGFIKYSFDYASSDKEPFTRKSRTQFQADYAFAKKDYAFIRTDLKRHKYASFAKEFTYSTGYGRTFIDQKKQRLSIEVGPGYRYAKPQEDSSDNERIEEGIIRSVMKFRHSFHDKLTFYLDTSLETGQKNTISLIDAKFENKILDDLSLVLNFSHSYTQNVPKDTENHEFSNKVNLRYLF
ncbi:DUF481 domain-containing protein [Motilimonas eburnea]|uniref:DUF481 domain-containing protein n=1 Tax=Motilimonas eburnea TaxID=1737488 RepID=UPI001E606387|nr:DUF481 domain-containing protein [Motilimonas eburnea]MCE2570681.1 DUF481 domain-containing protein [Motilimonas eburnea]